jgi:hypothetical protein
MSVKARPGRLIEADDFTASNACFSGEVQEDT